MKHSRKCFIGYPNTLNFIKNTLLCIVFSTLFSVFVYPDETLSLMFDKFDILICELKFKKLNCRIVYTVVNWVYFLGLGLKLPNNSTQCKVSYYEMTRLPVYFMNDGTKTGYFLITSIKDKILVNLGTHLP